MLKSYEATYDHGQLKWADGKPAIEDGRRVLVVVEAPDLKRKHPEEVQRILDKSRGAWGRDKTLDAIDREIDAVRAADWDREWSSAK